MPLDGYLLDTCLLSALLDPTKTNHAAVCSAVDNLEEAAPKYVSVITFAELRFGIRLAALRGDKKTERLDKIVHAAKTHPPLNVTKHTAEEYGFIKAELANKYLDKALRRDGRPRWIEEWVDKATGQKLQIDENDLWLCAQAKERNLILLTAENKINRIKAVVSEIRIETI
ncbi:MAG TPA: PIN domain-containing protein [Syntrophales bacterium]|nr:PIN domain-containing protein [Syntrophales bacterium]